METMKEAVEAIRKAILTQRLLFRRARKTATDIRRSEQTDLPFVVADEKRIEIRETAHWRELFGLIDAYNFIIYGKARTVKGGGF